MDSSMLITSNEIYLEDGCRSGTILLKDGKLAAFYEKGEQLPLGLPHMCVEEHKVIPGIIDVHSHGYCSWSAKTIDKEEIKGLSRILPSIGVTSTLATTTAWKEQEFTMLHAIADAIEEGCEGTRILGIHMEGPFYHPDRHNATLRQEVIPPTIEKAQQYFEAARGHLSYMTIAPEVEGASKVIQWLSEKGVIMGAGHTTATYEELKKGIQDGIRVSIHTGNAMQQIDRRNINALGGALLDSTMYCEIICDLYHLSKEMLELMFLAKRDFSKFIMISDSDLLSGIEPGSYYAFGKNVHIHEDGRILLDDGTISGSSKYVLYGMKNLVEKLQLPLSQVVRMSALNPAILLGIDKEKGSLKVGKDGDVVILNKQFEVEATFVEGKLCYQKNDPIIRNQNFSQICKRIA